MMNFRIALRPLLSALCLALPFVLSAANLAAEDFSINRAEWRRPELRVRGEGMPGQPVTVTNATDGSQVGSTVTSRSGSWFVRVAISPVPCAVRAESAGQIAQSPVRNAPQNCGGSTTVTLSGLSISGPNSVAESSSTAFQAMAAYSDGSTGDVTATALWSENSTYASISAGTLLTQDVPGDQTISITASYTSGGVTRTANRSILIVNSTVSSGSHFGRFASFQGTGTCLTCHRQQAEDFHGSAHYQWKGDTRYMVNPPGPTAGKLGGINDFCIYPDINWIGILKTVDGQDTNGGCAQCHAGLGAKPSPDLTTAQLENIDCLICHSPSYKRKVASVNGVFRFVPDEQAMGMSALEAAWNISRPSSGTCLNCHTRSGGGNNFKRGDIEEAHRNATRDFDVHLAPKAAGGAGLSCLSCHTSSNHRIAGRGTDLREVDSLTQVRCKNCHPAAPHGNSRLDTHAKRIDCTSCHIPAFARGSATDMRRDWSLEPEVDATKRLYDPNMLKASHVVPEYRFFNGMSHFYNFGEPAIPAANGRVLMSGPAGTINDPGARIFPFKRHEGNQPVDPVSDRLLPLKIGIFFQTGDLTTAVEQGAAGVNWTYNGYEFAETERYMGIFHEVAPSEQALSCTSCHEGDRVDFALLGYTPKSTNNGKPLCASCHGDKSGAWGPSELFTKVHEKHVTDKKLDCSNCHTFSAAR